MALGLCVIWGYGGILSFGQTALFGVAGYTYGILALNFGPDHGLTLVSALASVAVSALVAAVLGYFLFFGRISGVFLGIVTLSVTLVFERFMAQTAGPEWHVGAARLNGFNGMSGMAPLTIPWPGDDDLVLSPDIPLYYVVLALLVLVYLGLRILVNSSFGNVLVAIRENPQRATMLGYDVRKYQLAAFVDRRRIRRAERRALHELGPIHHALQHGSHRGLAARSSGSPSAAAAISRRR